MNDIQAEHSKISSIFHSLQPYNNQIKECLLIGWSISKLHYQTKVFTSKQDFIESIKLNPDNTKLMKYLN